MANHSASHSSTSNSKASAPFSIDFPPPEIADNEVFVGKLTQMVNEVYTTAEEGIFNDQYVRTNPEEVKTLLRDKKLAVASRLPSDPWDPAAIVGCIRVAMLSPNMGEFGMLVASNVTRGSGLGRQLVRFSEKQCRDRGATKMEIQLLVPTTFSHKLKSWVQPWYERMGYNVVRVDDFGVTYPRLKPLIITPCEYRIFEKDMTQA